MGMTYEWVAAVTQPAATVLFATIFLGVLVYAMWPGNRRSFDEAARIPLESNDELTANGGQNGRA
jgi:cytochrome c oxidase cbb3-type subunit IV